MQEDADAEAEAKREQESERQAGIPINAKAMSGRGAETEAVTNHKRSNILLSWRVVGNRCSPFEHYVWSR